MTKLVKNNGVKAPSETAAIMRAQAAQVRAARRGQSCNLRINPKAKVVELSISLDNLFTQVIETTYTRKELSSHTFYSESLKKVLDVRTLTLYYEY